MEKIVVIVGPTGVGKTKVSIALAKQFHGEIISGDAIQVYREMNIGTAKIRNDEMENIPHYLIDCYNFQEPYNVKLFQERARSYIMDIRKRGKLAILCGGTGLYIKAATYDYHFYEQEQDDNFIAFLQQRSNDEIWSMLQLVDPASCTKIHQNNRQRIIRALCIAHGGKKKSDIVENQEHKPVYDMYMIGLTMDREHLYKRIDQRVDHMMELGLFDEVATLVQKDAHIWQRQSFQGIGYKEWQAFFNGSCTKEECVEKIKKNSRNFAKRQYTWFSNQFDVHWYDVEQEKTYATIVQDVEGWIKT